MDDNLIKGLVNGVLFVILAVVAFVLVCIIINVISTDGGSLVNNIMKLIKM